MEDILSTIVVTHGDLCPSCYIFDGTASELSSFEEDMGIFITAMINEGHHEVEAGPVPGFHL